MSNKTSKINQNEMDRLYNFIWMAIYQNSNINDISKISMTYNGIQRMIIDDAKRPEKVNDEEGLLARLKLLDTMYKEIVEKNLHAFSEERGLTSEQAKEYLYSRIFKSKDEKEKESQDIGRETIGKEDIGQENKDNTQKQSSHYDETSRDVKVESREPNFKKLYDDNIIGKDKNGDKKVRYIGEQWPNTFDYHGDNTVLSITSIGKIVYSNVVNLESYINKYSILIRRIKDGNPSFIIKNVFSIINLSRMKEDENYRKAVIEQLLSTKNLQRQGNEDYIGELQEKEDSDNGEYEVHYSNEDYSAIKDYNEESERKLQEIIDEERGYK